MSQEVGRVGLEPRPADYEHAASRPAWSLPVPRSPVIAGQARPGGMKRDGRGQPVHGTDVLVLFYGGGPATVTGHLYDDALSALRNHVDHLGARLAIWPSRDDSRPDAHARRCASDAARRTPWRAGGGSRKRTRRR